MLLVLTHSGYDENFAFIQTENRFMIHKRPAFPLTHNRNGIVNKILQFYYTLSSNNNHIR